MFWKYAYNNYNLHRTVDYWFRDMLNFVYLEKSLGIVSKPHVVYDFSRKMSLTVYSTNWPNFIVWLPLFLEIFGNMFIATVRFPGCNVINFEVNLSNQAVFVKDQKANAKI